MHYEKCHLLPNLHMYKFYFKYIYIYITCANIQIVLQINEMWGEQGSSTDLGRGKIPLSFPITIIIFIFALFFFFIFYFFFILFFIFLLMVISGILWFRLSSQIMDVNLVMEMLGPISK